MAVMMVNIAMILTGIGSFLLLSPRIKGKNKRAINIEKNNGINMKERIFNR